MQNPGGSWMAFLAMTFAVVGLAGLFASYAAPLPLQRALARDAALDAAAAAVRGPDPQAAIEALRPRLDDSAAALLPVGGDMPARIARERAAMRARFLAEADTTDLRLHWLIALITIMGGLFGIAIMRFSARAR
jgi:hypothetical protein